MRLIVCLLASLLASPALSLDEAQRNTLFNVGQATAAANLCSKIEINEPIVAAVLAVKKIDIEEKDSVSAALKGSQKARETFAGWKEDAVCLAAMMHYGPNGQVPDLLRWKK